MSCVTLSNFLCSAELQEIGVRMKRHQWLLFLLKSYLNYDKREWLVLEGSVSQGIMSGSGRAFHWLKDPVEVTRRRRPWSTGHQVGEGGEWGRISSKG